MSESVSPRDHPSGRPSLERQCQSLSSRIPRALVSDSAWQRVCGIAGRLPNVWSSAILECRLSAESEQVDLLVCTSKWRGDREALGAGLGMRSSSEFGAARALLEAWSDPAQPWPDDVPMVWLEYDLPGERTPDPFALFSVDPTYPRAGAPRRLGSERLVALARLALACNRSNDVEGPLRSLARCDRALPSGGRFLHLGALPAHRGEGLRAVAALRFDDVMPWLRAIEWPGACDEAARALALVSGRFSRASVQLDLGLAVGPRLAVEYQVPTSPSRDPGWSRLIADLVAMGVCTPERGRAALGWIGDQPCEFGDLRWPVDLMRQLNVKIIVEPDARIRAKAYLCFEPRFRLL